MSKLTLKRTDEILTAARRAQDPDSPHLTNYDNFYARLLSALAPDLRCEIAAALDQAQQATRRYAELWELGSIDVDGHQSIVEDYERGDTEKYKPKRLTDKTAADEED